MSKTKKAKLNTPPVEELDMVSSEQTDDTEANGSLPTVGVVVNCLKLNIRDKAKDDAYVLCSVPVLSKLMIDDSKSTDEWLSVCTETGVEGFCMKKYVAINQ